MSELGEPPELMFLKEEVVGNEERGSQEGRVNGAVGIEEELKYQV